MRNVKDGIKLSFIGTAKVNVGDTIQTIWGTDTVVLEIVAINVVGDRFKLWETSAEIISIVLDGANPL